MNKVKSNCFRFEKKVNLIQFLFYLVAQIRVHSFGPIWESE